MTRAPKLTTFELPFARHHRRVRVHVPRGVEDVPPLLLLFDGQNVFDDAGSYAGGLHAHTLVAQLPKTVRRPIVVGVDHGNERRMHELWAGLDELLDFIVRRVIPAASHAAGHAFDPSFRAIGGASLGGLASLAAIARRPAEFQLAIAMSPSVWFARTPMLHELAHARFHPNVRAYVDVGRRESPKMNEGAEAAAALLARRLGPDRTMWRPDARGQHREIDWRRRLPKALRFALRRELLLRAR